VIKVRNARIIEFGIIVPEKTATEGGVAKSAEELVSSVKSHAHILDYGAGKLRNANFLVNRGFSVSIVETPLQLMQIRDKNTSKFQHVYSTLDEMESHDIVLCSFVLNVIPFLEERKSVLDRIYNLMTKDGYLYIEVPRIEGIRFLPDARVYNDGFVVGVDFVRIFQKGYEKDEILSFVQDSGFILDRMITTDDSYIVIVKKSVPIVCFKRNPLPVGHLSHQKQLVHS
jgi:hypothetical protein